ncbi:hypothetical protein, partial [Rhizobium sp. Rhizsp42]|uniref:hypothetical protein n=1 Tax=Rhizobium sp. Rhizsp42 TaxID=3243034 RepID=UPI0039B0BCA0
VEDLVLQFHETAGDARDVQQVVDELRHVAHLARDDVAGFQAQPFVLLFMFLVLGRASDWIEWFALFIR